MNLKKLFINLFCLAIYLWISTVLIVFYGPFVAVRNFVYGSMVTMSYPQIIAPLTLWNVNPPPKWKTMQTQIKLTPSNSSPKINSSHFKSSHSNLIELKTYKGANFSAQIVLVHDPKRIQLIPTKNLGSGGETVSEIAARTHALVAINAGGFQDRNWKGTGGKPIGTTIHNGKIITFDKHYPTIGFTDKGVLKVGYFTKQQILSDHIKEAASFGPILIKNGQGVIKGNGGWGSAPRTAIGQRPDGTVIMIVTDGRMVNGPTNLGATMLDLANLMFKYGAVNAANLDGGSSSTLVKNGKLINTPTDILGERKVATSFVVLPK